MKKIYIVLFLAMSSTFAKAQDFQIFLEAGAADANRLLENYFSPAFKGFGYAINGGWLNTAKPHKPLGFDLTFTASLARIPDSEILFTFNNADYSNISLRDGTSADIPTFFGPTTDPDNLPQLVFNNNTPDQFRFSAPQGFDIEKQFGLNATPAVMGQLGIGIIKNTELKIRWTPKVDIDDDGSTFKLIGFGVLHDIKQWIPGLKLTPIDISVFFGYTKMTTEYVFDSSPTSPQSTTFDVNGIVAQANVSKKFSVITVYGGLGINSANTNFALLGDYDTSTIDLPQDPIDFKFSVSSPRATLGFRLKLSVITLHADYTFQEYNLLTTGFGISVR